MRKIQNLPPCNGSAVQKIIARLAESGHLGRLTSTEARVLMTFTAYCDDSGLLALPLTLISRAAGNLLSDRTSRALKSLEAAGILIRHSTGGGKGVVTVRQLVGNPVALETPTNPKS